MHDLSSTPTPGLADGVHRHARERPHATALVLGGRRYSYGELAAAAQRIAAALSADAAQRRASAGGSTGGRARRAGVLASRSFETYAAMLGAAWAGAAYVPLSPKQPPARIASILARAGLDALVADEAGAEAIAADAVRSALPPLVLAGERLAAVLGAPAAEASGPATMQAGDAAYLLFTSGTTGTPKGVVVPVGAVAHFLACARDRYDIGPADRVGQFCDTTFDVSVFEIFAAFDGGASLHVVPEAQLAAPAGFVRSEALTVWTSVPSAIALMARLRLLEPGAFPSVRASFFIGEALPVESARAWQRAAPNSVVDNQYGPTEATVACTVQRVGEPVAETPGRGTVAIGKPYDGMHAEVVSKDGRFVADGETGELALSGPQLALGYLDDESLTAARFPTLEHPRLGRRRWYLTGDLAFRDAAGLLHCLGRTDHQVKVLGHRVELEDLESHLRAASGTDAVAAVAWPLVAGSATGLAAFVCGAGATAREIRERLRERVPAYMVPRRIVEVDALPLSTSGKVDRTALRVLLEEDA